MNNSTDMTEWFLSKAVRDLNFPKGVETVQVSWVTQPRPSLNVVTKYGWMRTLQVNEYVAHPEGVHGIYRLFLACDEIDGIVYYWPVRFESF